MDDYQEYIELIRKSRLLSDEQLDRALSEVSKVFESPHTVAALSTYLIGSGLLNSWQIAKLRDGKWKGFYLGKLKILEHCGVDDIYQYYIAKHVETDEIVANRISPKSRSGTFFAPVEHSEGDTGYDIIARF
jgi:hypothetical protein